MNLSNFTLAHLAQLELINVQLRLIGKKLDQIINEVGTDEYPDEDFDLLHNNLIKSIEASGLICDRIEENRIP